MGELHAEVLKYRLKNDYKLDVFMGSLQVTFKKFQQFIFQFQISYREVIDTSSEHIQYVEDVFDGDRKQTCLMRLRVEPSENVMEKFKSVCFMKFA
jgi:translation elongation factor EF-G